MGFSYSTGLAVIYLLYAIYEAFQLSRIIYYRHKIRSFKSAFFALLFFWALLRSIFFAFLVNVRCTHGQYAATEIVYWIGIPIQFSTFSLLVIYYAHLHHKHKCEWNSFKRKYMTIWIVVNLVFYLLEVVILGMGVSHPDKICNEPEWASHFHKLFSGTVFMILASVIGFYGWRVTRVLKASTTQTKLLARLSFPKIMTVSIGLFVVFAIRCAYDFTTQFSKILTLNISDDRSSIAFVALVVVFVFELIPTTLVLVLFGHVKATTLGALSKNKFQGREANYSKVQTDYSRLLGPNSIGKADVFNDPKRYDFDDESAYRASPSPSPYAYGNYSPYANNSISTDVGT